MTDPAVEGDRPTVLLTICTYQRLQDLRALLDSLLPAIAAHNVDLLVVDNDPAGSAEATVRAHEIRANYVLCSDPGIAQARNAALAHRHGYDYIGFIDDDETVEADWLTQLLDGMARFAADAATGPVVSLYPPDAPSWIVKGGFHQRERHPSGTVVTAAATNNLLIATHAFDRLTVPAFDTSFSRSGGSDVELTERLTSAGMRLVWVDSAVVRELVPRERLNARWIARRVLRGGNGRARLMARTQPRRAIVHRALRLVAVGTVRVGRSLATGRGLQAEDANPALYGLGMLGFLCGRSIHEYSRG